MLTERGETKKNTRCIRYGKCLPAGGGSGGGFTKGPEDTFGVDAPYLACAMVSHLYASCYTLYKYMRFIERPLHLNEAVFKNISLLYLHNNRTP